ncbi:MAG: GDYXXLXY domain-containing protein [Planctomycetota bacterium]|jgi:uncharacterized membrane-anchored protein
MSKKHWLFMVAVALQLLIVAGVPARRAYTLVTGTTVFLKTAPVDPYDIMSGYYMALSYEISSPARLPGAPSFAEGDRVHVTLEEDDDGLWRATGASGERPSTIPPGAVVIEGRQGKWEGITYGIEDYFIPEGMGREIEKGLREFRDTTRVEVKVDSAGNAALVRLHVGDRTYDY